MEPHPSMMTRTIVPWMERKIKGKGKGRNPNPKGILVRVARRRTCRRLNNFIVMS